MNVFVVGGGGREHAIVHAVRKSSLVHKIHCVPGNAGIAGMVQCHTLRPGFIKLQATFVYESK